MEVIWLVKTMFYYLDSSRHLLPDNSVAHLAIFSFRFTMWMMLNNLE